jgi:hypothetical protein
MECVFQRVGCRGVRIPSVALLASDAGGAQPVSDRRTGTPARRLGQGFNVPHGEISGKGKNAVNGFEKIFTSPVRL